MSESSAKDRIRTAPKEAAGFLRRNLSWVAGGVFLLLGAFLIFRASLVGTILLILATVMACLAGAIRIVSYFRNRPMLHTTEYPLAMGVWLVLLAGTVIIWPDRLLDLSQVLIRLSLLAAALVFLQVSLDAKRLKVGRWWIYLIASLLSVAFGLLHFVLDYSPVLKGVLLMLEGAMIFCLRIFRKKIDAFAAYQPAKPAVKPENPVQEAAPAAGPAPQEGTADHKPFGSYKPQFPEPPAAESAPAAAESAPAAAPAEAADEVHAAPQLPFDQIQS